jgi:hypothetical protein
MICKNCLKPREEHFPDLDQQYIKKPFWCVKEGRKIYGQLCDANFNIPGKHYENICFTAGDNLDYIEYEAKKRNLV